MAISHAQLKAFHAVAVHGGFTRAAERLFLSQPAISDQVRKLEEHYGVQLFHRTKRSVQLSELGERLLAITQRLFAAEGEAEELLSSSRALRSGQLTLAVDSPVHVLPYIARFNARYPGIRISLVTGNTDEALRRPVAYPAPLAALPRPAGGAPAPGPTPNCWGRRGLSARRLRPIRVHRWCRAFCRAT